MAMNVSFKKGLKAVLPSTRDANTFYYISDEFALYLGDHLISNEVTAAQFTALTNRVSAIETADFQTQINAILETLKSIATSDTVQAIDDRLAEVEKDYLTSEDKTELEGKVTAHETAVNTKFESYSTTEQMNAAIDADVKVVTDYITNHEEAWLAKTDISGLEQRMTAVEGVADAAQTAQEVSDAIDAKITALDLDNTYDAKNSAAQALTDAKGYTDDKIDDLIKSYIDGDVDNVINTLEEVAAWINNDTAGVTKIIEDVATNAAGIKQNKEDLDKVELKLNGIADGDGTVKAAIETATADMATNASVDTKLESYTKTADLGDLATKNEASLNLGQYAKTADLGDLATKNLSELNLSQYAKSADLGTAAAKNVDFFATAAQGEAGVAAKAVTDTLKSAAFVDTTAFDAAGTAAGLVGVSASVENGPTGVYAAIQGATTNTVKDCVDSINAVTTQLTWGSF